MTFDDRRFDHFFLNPSADSISSYKAAIADATEILIQHFALANQAYSGLLPQQCKFPEPGFDLCPEEGTPLSDVLQQVGAMVIQHSANVSHPTCIAHLHCPTLVPSLAAELLISATNQSMDSWDQSPAATFLEQRVIESLCQLFGFDHQADGVFTSGGTQSNFMGMLLARDRYAQKHFRWSIQEQGLPPQASQFRILCSDVAHFTIRQAAALLGLGQQAVVPVATDADYRLSPHHLEQQIIALKQEGLLPIAIVATAGTTDFGSIDPLTDVAQLAKAYDLWLHVDAAYGGALIMSDTYRHLLHGIAAADSLTIDFHKLFYQPISCGAFLIKERTHFDLLKLHADYLNPETNEDLGILDLVVKSVQTTRRFDALKLFISMQCLGRKTFADMIETTINTARETASLLKADDVFELANIPTINAVVFRYIPQTQHSSLALVSFSNQINQSIRLALMQKGQAIIAQTQIGAFIYLKFTLLNPRTTVVHTKSLLEDIRTIGQDLEATLLLSAG
ncbi:pyridoxal phosphate-dependent decarboxylase family protein [Stenomitos frigidus]|uniref:Aspartate aminotransferase family protein n=1 Tax=Stenomitos frigidus ULC18 TaxID=2107698 RepID=A0A2T1DXZ4_9CYAN|nr:aspartate aminotransferase family protein [Stenomitos frigidus]PSB25254.1 aspartate aminotransferase family protein [Stenomitos frigidus ULC18]